MVVSPLNQRPAGPESPFDILIRRAPAAANSDGTLTLVREAAGEVVTAATEKPLLRGIFAWLETEPLLIVGVGGLIEVKPISIATQGESFNEEFLAKFDKFSRLAAEISTLQIQIEQYKMIGLEVLASLLSLQEQIETLQTQLQTIAYGYGVPTITGAFNMVASAGDVGAPNDSAVKAPAHEIEFRPPSPLPTQLADIFTGNACMEGDDISNHPNAINWALHSSHKSDGWNLRVATGEIRYPRLEQLVTTLVGHLPSPRITERGPGKIADLAIRIAHTYPIQVIEEEGDLEYLKRFVNQLPIKLPHPINLSAIGDHEHHQAADLLFRIHPSPTGSATPDGNSIDVAKLGADVVPGGYLVIQTEEKYRDPAQHPEWQLIYDNWHEGFLAPSAYSKAKNRIIVLQRLPKTGNKF